MTHCPSCGENFDELGKHLAYADCRPTPSKYKKEVLRGILMGDAWVGTSGRCIQSEWACEDYARYVADELGWMCSGATRRTYRDEIFQISTVSCSYIVEEFSEWYRGGEKSWDISSPLTLTALTHLYACDGSLKKRRGRGPAAVITINNEEDRAEKISDWIYESGFPRPSVHFGKSTNIYFSTDDTPELLNKLTPVPGYEYKWM